MTVLHLYLSICRHYLRQGNVSVVSTRHGVMIPRNLGLHIVVHLAEHITCTHIYNLLSHQLVILLATLAAVCQRFSSSSQGAEISTCHLLNRRSGKFVWAVLNSVSAFQATFVHGHDTS